MERPISDGPISVPPHSVVEIASSRSREEEKAPSKTSSRRSAGSSRSVAILEASLRMAAAVAAAGTARLELMEAQYHSRPTSAAGSQASRSRRSGGFGQGETRPASAYGTADSGASRMIAAPPGLEPSHASTVTEHFELTPERGGERREDAGGEGSIAEEYGCMEPPIEWDSRGVFREAPRRVIEPPAAVLTENNLRQLSLDDPVEERLGAAPKASRRLPTT